MIKWALFQECKNSSIYTMFIYHTKKLNGKKYMKTLVVTEKVFDKIQRSFMIKKKKKLSIKLA